MDIEKPKEKKPAFNEWSIIKLLEQYDPNDLQAVSQPYAYVADYMVDVSLSASLADEILKYDAKVKKGEGSVGSPNTPGTPGTAGVNATGDSTNSTMSARDVRRASRRLGWFEKLRDGLEKGGEIGWFVVVCGDEERAIPSMDSSRSQLDLGLYDDEYQKTPKSASLRGFFHRRRNLPEEFR